ncbi:MAG TPA: type II toxin-antitoxin system RelE/ParE family toxin [Pirellulales bacterium]|nr:type II toxin-antitoxin system RelE/ParE family toxin [Pirellulales bacterium]
MNYRVVVQPNAKSDLRNYFLTAAEHAPRTAARWLERFEAALASLSLNPCRCALAPENDALEIEIRQLVFGKRRGAFRALFTVVKDEVHVLHIRRATMKTATPNELFG